MRVRWAAILLAIAPATVPMTAQRRDPPSAVTVPGTDLVVHAGWLVGLYDGCRFSVPLAWKRSDDTGFDGPHGSTFRIDRLRFADWAAHVAQVRNALAYGFALRDTTDDRVWIESRREDVTVDYTEARLEDGACTGMLRYSAAAALDPDLPKRIVESVAPDRPR
jgi:hypothetical protein